MSAITAYVETATVEPEAAQPSGPPSLDDARRAADVLVEAGAAQVLLYGSLARGVAHERSDIDLVAIFADLGDYAERRAMQRALTTAATVAAGRACDVHVTDVCEWNWRVERVSASFEHEVSADCVRLKETLKKLARPARKPIGMPTSNIAEAASKLDGWVLSELRSVDTNALPARGEVQAALENDEGTALLNRADRHVRMCASSSMAVEKSLKVLMLAGGDHPPQHKQLKDAGHDVGAALVELDVRTRYLMAYAVTSLGLKPDDLSKWRVEGTYADDVDVLRQEALARADVYVRTAMIVAHFMADELARRGAAPADLAPFRREINSIWRGYAEISTFDGEPRITPLPTSPLLETPAPPQ